MRAQAKAMTFIGEKNMRIIEPSGVSRVTVLKTDGNSAVLKALSLLLPKVAFAEFESLYDAEKRQRHGLYIRSAGKIIRRAEASIGIETNGWSWDEEGEAADWESTETYKERAISKRQTPATLISHMAVLGFDLTAYVEGVGAQRTARFRGGPCA